MLSQEKSVFPNCHKILYSLYACFGLAISILWVYDMIVYQKKVYTVSAVIIIIFANLFQCFSLYNSIFKEEYVKISRVLIYLGLLITGIAIYVSAYTSNNHFSICTVASILTQILYALYGIVFILGNNQKRKEDEFINESNVSTSQEIDRPTIYLYYPELPDNIFESYNEDDSVLDNNVSDYDLNGELKYLFNSIQKNDEKEEESDNSHHFKYPERIYVSDDSIFGVVDDTNPYSSRNPELYGIPALA